MANRYWVAGGTGNYNSTTNWSATSGGASGASVPVAADDIFFDANSGSGTAIITSASNCRSVNLTGYVGTIQFDNDLILNSTSTFNLGTGAYTLTGVNGIRAISSTLAITSNGTTWTKSLTLNNNSIVVTMNDALTITGVFGIWTSATINGFTINIGGDFTTTAGITTISGTTSFVFNGNTTWTSSGGQLRNNVTINTAGTITMSGTINYNTGTFTYTAGTVNSTSFTLGIGAGATTFNCSGMTWQTVSANGTASTITFTSNFNVVNFNLQSSLTYNNNTVNISGNLTVNNTIGSSGTSVFLFNGTGTWSHSGTVAYIANPVTINTAGTLTLGTTVGFGGSTLTYTSGTIVSTGSTLQLNSTAMTINTSGMSWNNVTLAGSSGATFNLSSNLNVLGNFTFNTGGTSTIVVNNNTINVGGNLTVSGNSVLQGTSSIILNGTGTWSHTSTGSIRNNLTINTLGTITISGTVRFNTNTLTYTAGTVIATGSTLEITSPTTLNTNGINWNNISTSFTGAITLGSNLTLTGTLTVSGGTLSFTLGGNSLISANSNLTLGTSGVFTMPANQTFKTLTVNASAGGINSNTLTITENLVINAALSGSVSLIYAGTGTWTASAATSIINPAMTINTAGTLTISGTVYKSTSTFTYISGTIIDTGATVVIGGTINCNISGVTWQKLLVNGAITLSSNINAVTFGTTGNTAINFVLGGNSLNFTHLELGSINTTTLPTAWVCQNIEFKSTSSAIINGNSITINGDILQSGSGSISGTTTFTYAGSGTWSQTGTVFFTNSFTINTAGTLTFNSGNLGGGVFTYTAGTFIVSPSSTLYIRSTGTTMNHGTIVWENVVLGNSLGSGSVATLTLNNKLICDTLTFGLSNTTFSGTDGTFDTYEMYLGSPLNSSQNITLVSTKTYLVRQNMQCVQAPSTFPLTLKSTVAGSQAIFTLLAGSTINIGFLNATDINSSLGRTIYSYRGIFSNTLNWQLLPTDVTAVSSSSVFVN